MVLFYLLCVQGFLWSNDGKLLLFGSAEAVYLNRSCTALSWKFYHLLKFRVRSVPQRIPVSVLIPFQNELQTYIRSSALLLSPAMPRAEYQGSIVLML